jgi:hypothetical protein
MDHRAHGGDDNLLVTSLQQWVPFIIPEAHRAGKIALYTKIHASSLILTRGDWSLRKQKSLRLLFLSPSLFYL